MVNPAEERDVDGVPEVRGPATPPTFDFRGVSRIFRAPDGTTFTALSRISLDIEEGSFVCLLGPSGCGKTTVLNMAAGLLRPSSGEVLFRGTALDSVNTDAGYMTQGDTLLPWSTVSANVSLGLDIRGVGTKRDRRDRVAEVLDRVGLSEFAGHYPSQLSGGMRKRVALARCLVYEPETLLMDEPFAALDAQLRSQLQLHLLDLWERDRKTVIFVTHDIDEAILLADRVIVFGTRPGRVIAEVPVEIERPRPSIFELRTDRRYSELSLELWRLLQNVEAA